MKPRVDTTKIIHNVIDALISDASTAGVTGTDIISVVLMRSDDPMERVFRDAETKYRLIGRIEDAHLLRKNLLHVTRFEAKIKTLRENHDTIAIDGIVPGGVNMPLADSVFEIQTLGIKRVFALRECGNIVTKAGDLLIRECNDHRMFSCKLRRATAQIEELVQYYPHGKMSITASVFGGEFSVDIVPKMMQRHSIVDIHFERSEDLIRLDIERKSVQVQREQRTIKHRSVLTTALRMVEQGASVEAVRTYLLKEQRAGTMMPCKIIKGVDELKEVLFDMAARNELIDEFDGEAGVYQF